MKTKKYYIIPVTSLQTCCFEHLICGSDTYSISGDVVSGGGTGGNPGGGL